MPIARPLPLLLLIVAVSAPAADIVVRASRSGDVLQVEASAELEGSLENAWQVLTDYGRLAEFVPDLQVSRVISRDHNTAVVEQKGEARLLFFSYPIDVRLAITEKPREQVVSRAVAGNFREMHSTYALEARQGRVFLRYSGRLEPDFYVPPLIGTYLLRTNVESMFRALVEEIERQQKTAAGHPHGSAEKNER
jgi:ribosome-associated toxin RatA of RatAB toxin-antitoxin module